MTQGSSGQESLSSRAALFHTLARGFAPPVLGLAADVQPKQFLASLGAAVTSHPGSLSEEFERVRDACVNGADGDPTISQEYTYLFMRRTKVPLTETSYGVDLTFAKPREMADIGAFHEAFGLQLTREAGITPDHLSVQLEFLAVLCAKEAYASEHGMEEARQITRDARARYLTDHMSGWLPLVRARIEKHARIAFYPAIVSLVGAAVVWEHKESGAGEPRTYGLAPVEDDRANPVECGVAVPSVPT